MTGVSVIPADGYLEPATDASRKIIDRFGQNKGPVEVAKSNSRGKNPFPAAWRLHSFYVDALPVLNESGRMEAPLSSLPAHQHLIEKVRGAEGKTLLLFTGPLTDLARALDEAPDIEAKIEKLVWMGGTFEKGMWKSRSMTAQQSGMYSGTQKRHIGCGKAASRLIW